jgi:hypothetical protein
MCKIICKLLKWLIMPPITTSTSYAVPLPRHNTNTALLTESTQNVWCLPETAKTLSV